MGVIKLKRIGRYLNEKTGHNHILVQYPNGQCGAFWTAKRYDSIELLKEAINDGSAFDGKG